MTTKKAKHIKLDPMGETADINEGNNVRPKNGVAPEPSKFSLFKSAAGRSRGQSSGANPMQKRDAEIQLINKLKLYTMPPD